MDNKQLNELLKKYKRYSDGDTSCKFELKIEDENIDTFDFRKYDLNNSFFVGDVFELCDFTNVYLSGSYFGGSKFVKCIFVNNTLRKAKWNAISFDFVQIAALDAMRVEFFDSKFIDSNFSDSSFLKCAFDGSSFDSVIFKNCDFQNTSFKDCKFNNVFFFECSMINCDIDRKCDGIHFINPK